MCVYYLYQGISHPGAKGCQRRGRHDSLTSLLWILFSLYASDENTRGFSSCYSFHEHHSLIILMEGLVGDELMDKMMIFEWVSLSLFLFTLTEISGKNRSSDSTPFCWQTGNEGFLTRHDCIWVIRMPLFFRLFEQWRLLLDVKCDSRRWAWLCWKWPKESETEIPTVLEKMVSRHDISCHLLHLFFSFLLEVESSRRLSLSRSHHHDLLFYTTLSSWGFCSMPWPLLSTWLLTYGQTIRLHSIAVVFFSSLLFNSYNTLLLSCDLVLWDERKGKECMTSFYVYGVEGNVFLLAILPDSSSIPVLCRQTPPDKKLFMYNEERETTHFKGWLE